MARARQSVQTATQRLLVQELEALERAGVTHLPKVKRPLAAGAARENVAELPALPDRPARAPASQPARPADAKAALEVIRVEVAGCTRCTELAETRTQTVFGSGNPQARLCFLGEAPGADEDLQGEPFVGRAGQLLTDIITKGMKMRREDVYILNVLKCRPPGNRAPLPQEVSNCRGYLDRQLAIVRPEYICCLGATAAQTLLQTTVPIGKLRGNFLEYQGIPVMCTYHPAYLLRDPARKRDVWEDMKVLLTRMGVKL